MGNPAKIEVVQPSRSVHNGFGAGLLTRCSKPAKRLLPTKRMCKIHIEENLVAVISNGTAVLGLGISGPKLLNL